jgi:hypothetical protein
MGLFDRMFGREPDRPVSPRGAGSADDDQAIARYRYLLRTAPPETIEQTHAEAFSKLTPAQRKAVLDELAREAPEEARHTPVLNADNPQALAQLATRAELRRPGTMERTFGRVGAMPGIGTMMAGTFLSTMAGVVLGTALANTFFEHDASVSGSQDGSDSGAHDASDGFVDAGDDGGGFDGGDVGGFDV